MSSVLESVEWGKASIQLIDQIKNLDPDKPAVLHIRHSERHPLTTDQATIDIALTETGQKTSYEYGKKLPTDRTYHHYHTISGRTKETASNIHQGILDNKGKSTGLSTIKIIAILDPETNSKYRRKIINESKNEIDATKKMFYRWLSGYAPKSVIKPSKEFAQEIASLMMEKVRKSDQNNIHIWVTHDNFIATFIHHWFGEYLDNWIEFLEGFIIQFYEDYMVFYFRGEKKQVEYPYWWNI
jgi:broad specificity phosphatase PhoE